MKIVSVMSRGINDIDVVAGRNFACSRFVETVSVCLSLPVLSLAAGSLLACCALRLPVPNNHNHNKPPQPKSRERHEPARG